MELSIGKRLEQYTLKRPQEVLLVTAQLGALEDQIAIFKGFSSSLVRPTAFDPEIPVLSPEAKITAIDRLASPYNPNSPQYLQKGLSWQEMEKLLQEVNV